MFKSIIVILGCGAAPAAEINPCALLTDAEVRKVLPEVGAGKVDRKLAKHGILYCLWEGKGEHFYVRADQDPGSVREEVEALALGFVDPLQPSAGKNVRYEVKNGIGNEALAVVERADPSRGIIGHAAYLGVQKGQRVMILASNTLAQRDRATALKILEELAKVAAARL